MDRFIGVAMTRVIIAGVSESECVVLCLHEIASVCARTCASALLIDLPMSSPV